MLTDERAHIRTLAFRRVIKAREVEATGEADGVRKFSIPNLNFEAQDYIDMIDWQTIQVTPPPVLNDTTTEDLQAMLQADVPA